MSFWSDFQEYYAKIKHLPRGLDPLQPVVARPAASAPYSTQYPGVLVRNGSNGNGNANGASAYSFATSTRLSSAEVISRFERAMMRAFREPVHAVQEYMEVLEALLTTFLDQLGPEHRQFRPDYLRTLRGWLDANDYWRHVYCLEDTDRPPSGSTRLGYGY